MNIELKFSTFAIFVVKLTETNQESSQEYCCSWRHHPSFQVDLCRPALSPFVTWTWSLRGCSAVHRTTASSSDQSVITIDGLKNKKCRRWSIVWQPMNAMNAQSKSYRSSRALRKQSFRITCSWNVLLKKVFKIYHSMKMISTGQILGELINSLNCDYKNIVSNHPHKSTFHSYKARSSQKTGQE